MLEADEILIKVDVDDMGKLSKIIQDRKGDFLSIDQEENKLVVIIRVSKKETENIKNDLKNILGDNFYIFV